MKRYTAFVFIVVLLALLFLSPRLFACGFLNLAALKDQPFYEEFTAAEKAWSEARWEDAVQGYRIIVREAPEGAFAAEAHFRLGLYEQDWGYYDKALAHFDKVIAWMNGLGEERVLQEESFVQEEIHEAKLQMATIYVGEGRYEEAGKLLRDVMSETRDWRMMKLASQWAQEAARLDSLVRQGKGRSCGHEALSHVLMRKGLHVSDDELLRAIGSSSNLSMEQLRDALTRKGLRAEGLKLDLEQLGDVDFPAIALLRPGHYVVVTGMGEKKVDVVYPGLSGGVLAFDKDVFRKWWTGNLLAFAERLSPDLLAARISEEDLARIRGGHNEYPPPGSQAGGAADNPNQEFQIVEQCVRGCEGGMPRVLVNTKNLNVVVEERDFSLSGLGPKVDLIRYHNANATADAGLGYGWSHRYQTYIRGEVSGNAVVKRGSGTLHHFTYIGSGSFASPKGINDELTQNPDGTYSLWVKNERVTYEYSADGTLQAVRDRNGNALTFQAQSNIPLLFGSGRLASGRRLAVSADGYVYVSDYWNHRVVKFDTNGNFILQWGSYGCQNGRFAYPRGIAVDSNGFVYVLDQCDRIQKFTSSGQFVTKWGSTGSGSGQFNFSRCTSATSYVGLAVGQGFVFVSDHCNRRIQKFTLDGQYVTQMTLDKPRGVTVSPDGYLYVSYVNGSVPETMVHKVRKYTLNFQFISEWGSVGIHSEPGQLYYPGGLVVDSSGYVYVTDIENHRVQKFTSTGTFIALWGGRGFGDGEFYYPEDVGLDSTGHVYVGCHGRADVTKFLGDEPMGIRVDTIVDAAGRSVAFAYNAGDQITSITGPGGQVTFTYDSYGQMATSTDLAGVTTTYVYDNSNHYLRYIVTPKGSTYMEYCWDQLIGWHLVSIRDAAGHTWKYGYQGATDQVKCCPDSTQCSGFHYNRVFVKDPLSHTTWYESNTDGFTAYITDPLNHTTSFGYDANGNRNRITNANNDAIQLTYDAYGNILTITEPPPLSHTTTFAYDAKDNLTDVWDALNRNYHLTYDANDNLLTIQDPLTRVTTFTYNTLGQLETMVNARGKTFGFAYDTYGNLADVNGPLSYHVGYGYDLVGRVIEVEDPGGHLTALERDLLGRLTKITHPDLKDVLIGRDCCNVTSITDENDRVTTYQYSVINNLTKVIDARLKDTNFGYDTASRLTSLTDTLSQVTGFGYDNADRLTGVTYPEQTTETYVPDNVGRIVTRVDGNGVTTTYTYDPMGRLTGITAPNLSITYGYDEVGNLTSMIDATGTTTFTYDALNRLESLTTPTGQIMEYTYDEVGNLLTIETLFGMVGYAYDDLNRLSTLTLPGGAQVTYQYDGSGNLMGVLYPNSTYASYAYDTRNRLTSLINGKDPGVIISEYTYTLDGVGNRTNVAYTEPLGKPYTLGDVSYTYLTGNRVQTAGDKSYTYDSNGNVVTRTQGGNQTTYTYDPLNRLTQLVSQGGTVQYQYDGLGNRVTKIAGGVTTRYLIDPNGALPQVIAEMDAGGAITSYYVYDPWGLVAKMLPGGTTYFYHFDGLGSTIAMTNAAGTMVNKYAYDEYGNILNQVEAVSNPFKYVGRYGVMQDDTGLLYMRARYYDPETGRFLSKDPIGYRGGFNLYMYGHNSPVNWIDPLGLRPGDRYPSLADAAIDAITDINPSSIRTGWEWGGIIFFNPDDGTYSYTPARTDCQARWVRSWLAWSRMPERAWPVADYHTHGKYLKPTDEQFSPGDIRASERIGLPAVMGTPKGKIWMYVPTNELSGQIGFPVRLR